MSSRIVKACDGCRVRKVKCNGALPCSQCAHLDLPCQFSPPAAKRKPGVRNRLVDQLRGRGAAPSQAVAEAPHYQHQSQHNHQAYQHHDHHQHQHGHGHGHVPGPASSTSPGTPPSPFLNTATTSSGPATSPAITSVAGIIHTDHHSATSPSGSSSNAGTSNITYPADFFLRLLPEYDAIVYPFSPIITSDELRTSITNMHTSHQDAALVYSFAAVTINLTQTSWNVNVDVAAQMTEFIQRSLAAHRMADMATLSPPPRTTTGTSSTGPVLGELPVTIKRIATCIFLEISMMAFRLFERSFVILREAISLLSTLKVFRHDPDDPSCTLSRSEIARRQRLYWECFIHERFVNIMSGCPSILPPLATGLPIDDPEIPPHVDAGFRILILLFRSMDDSFLAHWNALQDSSSSSYNVTEPMTAQWVESKQAELDRHETATAAEEDRLRAKSGSGLSELQHADLFVTRLWLRTLIWQLALSRGLLRSAPAQDAHQGLSLHFPALRLSAQLRSLVSRLESVASIGTHGSGILQKLFEITTTVSDVLALPPGQTATQEDVKARMEDFIFLVDFLFQFERISPGERDYMREKLDVLQHLYTVVDFGSVAARSA